MSGIEIKWNYGGAGYTLWVRRRRRSVKNTVTFTSVDLRCAHVLCFDETKWSEHSRLDNNNNKALEPTANQIGFHLWNCGWYNSELVIFLLPFATREKSTRNSWENCVFDRTIQLITNSNASSFALFLSHTINIQCAPPEMEQNFIGRWTILSTNDPRNRTKK